MRVGQGFDAHAFSDDPARPLWLGLVRVDGAPGLAGHSDADVATHALCDALLGACDLGDLGRYFPSDDPQWKDVPSRSLLVDVGSAVAAAGFQVVNADVTIVAQAPRLSANLANMASALTGVVGAPVSVKATTTDGLGAIGAGDGIAALAIALVDQRP